MNLYIFNETSRAAVYGVGTYIRELTSALKDSDVNICVVHLNSEKTDNEQAIVEGIRYWYMTAPIRWNALFDWHKYYRNVVYLLRLQIKNTDNLVFHVNNNLSGKLAEELKKTFVCKIISSIHCLDWCFSLLGNVTRFRKILAMQETGQHDELKKPINESYQKEKGFFDLADKIICLSEHTQQILQDDYKMKPDKITVIYNGLTDRLPIADRQELRRKYDMPDIPLILFAGRLDDSKGLMYAIQAFKKTVKTKLRCHFIITGSGTYDVYLKACEDIWRHVTWTGLIRREKLFDLYSIADIGVMPSFHEQCSYVAIEMMMHGLPIIGSTTTGLKEMIIDGETGLHIPVIEQNDSVEIDTDLLAEKILYLLQNPLERERMGANARRRYETVYSAEIFRKNMTAFYQSLFYKPC